MFLLGFLGGFVGGLCVGLKEVADGWVDDILAARND